MAPPKRLSKEQLAEVEAIAHESGVSIDEADKIYREVNEIKLDFDHLPSPVSPSKARKARGD